MLLVAFNYEALLASQLSLSHSRRPENWKQMENKGYHKHKVATALLSALCLGFNSSAHPLLGREDVVLLLAGPFLSSKWCADHLHTNTMEQVPSFTVHLSTRRGARKKSLQRDWFVCKQHNRPLFLSCTETALTIQAFVQPWAAIMLGYRVLHWGQPRPAVATSSFRWGTGSFRSAPAKGLNLPSTAGCEQVPGNYSDCKNTGTSQGRGSILAVCS